MYANVELDICIELPGGVDTFDEHDEPKTTKPDTSLATETGHFDLLLTHQSDIPLASPYNSSYPRPK
jgi:hypothetical protein